MPAIDEEPINIINKEGNLNMVFRSNPFTLLIAPFDGVKWYWKFPILESDVYGGGSLFFGSNNLEFEAHNNSGMFISLL